jgi:two-component system, cell cycle response regulator DivK
VSRTILVIEDNAQNLYLMKFLLEREGYVVIAAVDGPSGIDMAREQRPDGILLDIQLPRMDGYAVAVRLREDPDFKLTPIIVVTSYVMPGDREKAFAHGATDYLEKPINSTRFIERVRQHVPV